MKAKEVLLTLAAAMLMALTTERANAQTGNTNYGNDSLFSLTSGSFNSAFGDSVLYSNTIGDGNYALGYQSLYSNTEGTYNIANGFQSLYSNTTSSYNIATGYQALYSNTTGSANVAHGNFALLSNTEGYENIGIGSWALWCNTTGAANIATGSYALGSNTTGVYNIATGVLALGANTEGYENVATGTYSQLRNTTGAYNISVGWYALKENTTGSENLAIGNGAGYNLTTGDRNICIGPAYGVAGESNTIRIGASWAQYAAYMAGIRGVTTGNNDAVAVLIDSNGQLGTVSSSRRYKEGITDMGKASERLFKLRPVTFNYKKPYADGRKPLQFGLIAEEVAENFPELAVLDSEGQPETVKYQDLTPMLLNEFQKEHKRVADLESRVAALEKRLNDMDAKDRERETRLTRLEGSILSTRPASVPVKLETAAR